MPIEFTCTHCGALLRVPDGTAGQASRCGHCGATLTIPAPPPPGQEASPGGTPFGTSAERPPLTAAASLTREQVREQLVTPATILRLLAGAWFVLLAVFLLVQLLGIVAGGRPFVGMGPFGPAGFGPGIARFTGNTFQLAMAAIVFVGTGHMRQLRNYGFAVAAAIIACIPCIGPCFVLSIPFGIWALVVLFDPAVRAAFES